MFSTCRQGHPLTIHVCAVQFVHKRGTHTTRLAQELHCHLRAPENHLVIWCVPCLILGCLTCLSPRALHLPHSLLLLRHKNTKHNRYNKSNSENTQYITHISKLPQSTSCAIKNHSGVKTCRVPETGAQQLPQVMSPENLRLFKDRSLFWRYISIIWCTRKSWRRRSTSSYHRSGGIQRDWDGWRAGFSNIRDVLLPIADAFRRFRGKHCRFWSWRWRVTKDADFTTVCPESFGETRCNGHAGEGGKCTIHSSRSKGKFEVSFIWTGKLDQEFCVQKR